MALTYYKAVGGITDGMTYYTDGMVFPATESLDANYAATGGKDGDRVLYEKASADEYNAYLASIGATIPGHPEGIVGFAPTGADSLVESQKNEDGTAVKAARLKPAAGDPLETTHPEAERRLTAEVATAPAASSNCRQCGGGGDPSPPLRWKGSVTCTPR